jgi:nucleoid-associated protein YgaU
MPLNPKPAAAKKRGKTDAAAAKKGNARPEASAQADGLPEDRQLADHRDPPSSPDPQVTESRTADQPPPVADSFRAKLEPWDDAGAGPAKQDYAAAESVAARVAAASAGPPANAATHRTRHCIAEGDTLPELAARYLGDRNRYQEIFQANRQVLPDPRLLPIGEEIWIMTQLR